MSVWCRVLSSATPPSHHLGSSLLLGYDLAVLVTLLRERDFGEHLQGSERVHGRIDAARDWVVKMWRLAHLTRASESALDTDIAVRFSRQES